MVLFPIGKIPRSVRPSSVAALDPKAVYLHTGAVLPSTIRLIAHVPEHDGLFRVHNVNLTSRPSATTSDIRPTLKSRWLKPVYVAIRITETWIMKKIKLFDYK